MPITASYNGSAPIDASGTPDYKINIEITKISIYGARWTGSSSGLTLEWNETTPGHEQTSPSISDLTPVGNGAGYLTAANYKQLVWDAPDYAVSLALLNDAFTRTFDFPALTGNEYQIIDGLEIEGRVVLTYTPIPEPSSVVLIFMGSMGLVFRRRFKSEK